MIALLDTSQPIKSEEPPAVLLHLRGDRGIAKNGGQRWNRTTDTRIFKSNDQFLKSIKSVACDVCPYVNVPVNARKRW
jgi:hypothetical protein